MSYISPKKKKAPTKGFKQVRAWQVGMELVTEVYLLTDKDTFANDYSLADQLRRASVSVPSNVAEGYDRISKKQYCQFLGIARGSAAEVETQLLIAVNVGYLTEEEAKKASKLSRQVAGLLRTEMREARRTQIKTISPKPRNQFWAKKKNYSLKE